MQTERLSWSPGTGWKRADSGINGGLKGAQLVLYFGTRSVLASGACFDELKSMFPVAAIVGCSTGGQIYAGDVSDGTVVAIVMQFANTQIKVVDHLASDTPTSFAAGLALGAKLGQEDLKHIFVLSDGLLVNGSQLVAGIRSSAGPHVTLTGGLAGDGAGFETTVVGANAPPGPGRIAAIGFYGSAISIGHGSAGGWDEFGPKRLISKSNDNVLFELDGKPALDLYERYLGDEAAGLPSTALLYPLLIKDPANPTHAVVRTVLAVDRENRTMTFAGDMPRGWSAQLMRGHFDRLADGAADAARQACVAHRPNGSDVAAILISCIGRRILMGQNIINEVTAAENELGGNVQTVGFYSYGEISPHAASGVCELHNQTMTITTFTEAA